ncbi:hypothetical protein OAF37_04075 [Rubripirellula sp.]|nr:hypothetical protein [Rubripirellula sp.]MDB4770862.1 hypothetical protein [bacterium]
MNRICLRDLDYVCAVSLTNDTGYLRNQSQADTSLSFVGGLPERPHTATLSIAIRSKVHFNRAILNQEIES